MEKKKVKYKIDPSTDVFNLHEYSIILPSREIFLHTYIDIENEPENEVGVDYRMAATFIKNISLLNQQGTENILVHQQCCGGDWNYGMAIYDAIKTSVAPVIILAYAHARSMSSITLQAADLRILMPDCMFLVHHGDLEFCDRAIPVVSNVDFWKRVEVPQMLEIYARRCKEGKFFKDKKMSKKDVTGFISRKMEEKTDWILTAEEAVRYGFADGILGKKGFETIEKIRIKTYNQTA